MLRITSPLWPLLGKDGRRGDERENDENREPGLVHQGTSLRKESPEGDKSLPTYFGNYALRRESPLTRPSPRKPGEGLSRHTQFESPSPRRAGRRCPQGG